MKYNAKQLNNGQWAVFTGKKYFKSTVTDNKNDAVIEACSRSAQWYQSQMDACRNAWEEAHRANGKTDFDSESEQVEDIFDFDREWGNCLC